MQPRWPWPIKLKHTLLLLAPPVDRPVVTSDTTCTAVEDEHVLESD